MARSPLWLASALRLLTLFLFSTACACATSGGSNRSTSAHVSIYSPGLSEHELWGLVVKQDDLAGYRQYLYRFPAGPHAGQAKTNKEQVYARRARSADRLLLHLDYLNRYPQGAFAAQARSRVAALKVHKLAILMDEHILKNTGYDRTVRDGLKPLLQRLGFQVELVQTRRGNKPGPRPGTAILEARFSQHHSKRAYGQKDPLGIPGYRRGPPPLAAPDFKLQLSLIQPNGKVDWRFSIKASAPDKIQVRRDLGGAHWAIYQATIRNMINKLRALTPLNARALKDLQQYLPPGARPWHNQAH